LGRVALSEIETKKCSADLREKLIGTIDLEITRGLSEGVHSPRTLLSTNGLKSEDYGEVPQWVTGERNHDGILAIINITKATVPGDFHG